MHSIEQQWNDCLFISFWPFAKHTILVWERKDITLSLILLLMYESLGMRLTEKEWETKSGLTFFLILFFFAAGVWCLLSWAQEHANLAPTASGNWHAVQVHQATSLPFPRHSYWFHFRIHLGNHQRNQLLYSRVGMGSYPQVHSSVDLCSCTCHHSAASRNPYTTGRCPSSYLQADSCSSQPNWTNCKGICWSGSCSANHISIILQQSGVFLLYHVV